MIDKEQMKDALWHAAGAALDVARSKYASCRSSIDPTISKRMSDIIDQALEVGSRVLSLTTDKRARAALMTCPARNSIIDWASDPASFAVANALASIQAACAGDVVRTADAVSKTFTVANTVD